MPDTPLVGVVGPRDAERVVGFVERQRYNLDALGEGNALTTSTKGDKQWCPDLLRGR